jgi:hypothetical protein
MENPIPGLKTTTFAEDAYMWVVNHIPKLSADALGWIAIVLCHFAAIPTLIAVLVGQSDKLPPIDIMIFVWSALIMMFVKSLIDNRKLYIATISLGFAAQTMLMGLILFK